MANHTLVKQSGVVSSGANAVAIRTLQKELQLLHKEPIEGFTVEPDSKVGDARGEHSGLRPPSLNLVTISPTPLRTSSSGEWGYSVRRRLSTRAATSRRR